MKVIIEDSVASNILPTIKIRLSRYDLGELVTKGRLQQIKCIKEERGTGLLYHQETLIEVEK